MSWFLDQPLTWLVATLVAYRLGVELLARTRLSVMQPVLVAIVVLGAALLSFDVDYQTYAEGTSVLVFILGPATVALAVPLHRQLHRLRGFAVPMLVALVLGVLVSITSAILLVELLGGTEELARTMSPKATTTPVAIALSAEVGGIPALTAVLTITAGILGAVAGPWVLDRFRVHEPRARGIAIGGVSHGIGTARALAEDPVEGAFSGLAMGLTALLTSILIPVLVALLL